MRDEERKREREKNDMRDRGEKRERETDKKLMI